MCIREGLPGDKAMSTGCRVLTSLSSLGTLAAIYYLHLLCPIHRVSTHLQSLRYEAVPGIDTYLATPRMFQFGALRLVAVTMQDAV